MGTNVNPWAWQPSTDAWFASLESSVVAWQPEIMLGLESSLLVERLKDAVANRCEWLRHPCISRLTRKDDSDLNQRDLQLAIWIAAHTDGDLGTVTVPAPAMVWTSGGTKAVAAGQHVLRQLAAAPEQEIPCNPVVDVWSDSVGCADAGTWAARPPADPNDMERLTSELKRYLHSILFLERHMAPCHSWVSQAARISIPLRGEREGNLFRSSSSPDLPGAIHLDLLTEDQIIESLVHESAHLHLYAAEAAGPLIDPNHAGRYRSPLRPEPRPLRGILLAYHALAYIAAFYRDALDIPAVSHWSVRELESRMQQASDAEDTLLSAIENLRPAGREFFDMTRLVLEYSRR